MCNNASSRVNRIMQLVINNDVEDVLQSKDTRHSLENEYNVPPEDVERNLQNDSTKRGTQNVVIEKNRISDHNSHYWTKNDVEPSPLLIAAETLTFSVDNHITIDVINLKSQLQLTPELNLDNAYVEENSPEDPYATDHDDDPDYSPSEQAPESVGLDEHRGGIIEDNENENNENDNDDKSKRTRKRKLSVEKWRRNIVKRSRNKGETYKNWTNKKIPARQLKAPCQNCRMKCYEKISEDERKQIFTEYWKLGNINRQRDFISRLVDITEKKRIRVRQRQGHDDQPESRRNLTFHYHLHKPNGIKLTVCKTFFLNTLSISSQVVKTVANKLKTHVVVEPDKRGTVCKNSKLPDVVKQSVRNHINSFQPVESHYCRQKTGKVYLPASLNVTKMYSLYKTFCNENNITHISTEAIYRQVFCTEFNISFMVPKKDQCDFCNKFENSNEYEKSLLQVEFDNHMKNKKLSREAKDIDKERARVEKNFCAAVFDLEQILPVPKSEIGLAYYKLKLSTFNLTVFDLATKNCFCYMWYECIAKRGASEIGSCVFSFIKEQVEKSVNEFSLYSDNCSGQNRNRFIYSLYNYLTQLYNIKIRHSFLEHGHTQNEGDSAHSVIERASKPISIFSPEQWYTLVRTAKRNNPYMVKEMSQEDFWDLKHLLENTTLNWDKDKANERVQWSKIKIIETNPAYPNVLFYKYQFDEGAFRQINLLVKGRKRIKSSVEGYNLKQIYLRKIPLKKKKYDHLVFLCNKLVIPRQYHHFFQNLPHLNDGRESSDED